MKKIAAALAASALALAGCAAEGEAPTETAYPITSATPPHTVQPAQPYFTTGPMPEPETSGPSDAETMEAVLLSEGINLPPGVASEYASAVCADLGDGVGPFNIAMTAHKYLPMYDITQHGMMVGASVGAFCPEYGYIINQMGE